MDSALLEFRRAGLLDAFDPRLRIVSAVLFALVVASLASLQAAVAALLSACLPALSSGAAMGALGRRLLVLEGLVLLLVVTVPFSVPGEPLWRWGALSASHEGLMLAALIVIKANAVVLALLGLVGGLEPMVFGHALARLRVPDKLVHLLLMTVAQIHWMQREFLRLRQAMRARAFVPGSNRHTWRSYGWLTGMLLVRAIHRSRRMLDAMRCRGFQGRLYLLKGSRWQRSDTVAALVWLSGCALLVGMDLRP